MTDKTEDIPVSRVENNGDIQTITLDRVIPEFNGMSQSRELETGGKLTFGVGELRFPDGTKAPAVALELVGPDSDVPIMKGAMLLTTFGALLDMQRDLLGRIATSIGAAPEEGDEVKRVIGGWDKDDLLDLQDHINVLIEARNTDDDAERSFQP